MSGVALVVLICASLFAGACIGIVAAASLVAREASKSFALADARRRARLEALIGPETVIDQGELTLRADSREAADALQAYAEASRTRQDGLQGAGAKSEGPTHKAPCLPCLKARKALLEAKRAIFGP